MRRIHPLVVVLACAACQRQWSPPAHPDPRQILQEAEADVRARQDARALAKHLWFYKNALAYNPGLYGVRLSWALDSWYELAKVYPPAMAALAKARDEALDCVARCDRVSESFHEFVAINRVLGQGALTRDAFVALDRDDPVRARTVFSLALPELVKAKDYGLCGKYLRPREMLAEAVGRYRGDKAVAPEHGAVAVAIFSEGTATLVALLVLNSRTEEAEGVARQARAECDDASLRSALDKALNGIVPDVWP